MTFEETLAEWMPSQRWFAGKGARILDLAIVTDTELVGGDPGLHHLIVAVTQGGPVLHGGPGSQGSTLTRGSLVAQGSTVDSYQLFLGLREELPDHLRHVHIGVADDGRIAYDALHDQELTRLLLQAIADGGRAGPLCFAHEPGADIDTSLDSLVLTGEQSNTSMMFGEASILKIFRRPSPGPNPDLEVPRALAMRGSTHVAEPLGWFESRLDGAPVILGILSRYLRAASDGWSLAATSVRDLYAAEGQIHAADAGGDFAGEAYRLGEATAEVHRDLARAFGTDELPPEAISAAGRRDVRPARRGPGHRARAGPARRPARVGLRRPGQAGHPAGRPAGARRLPPGPGDADPDRVGAARLRGRARHAAGPAPRAVHRAARRGRHAALVRLRGPPPAAGPPDWDRLHLPALEWVRRNQEAFCSGYAAAGGIDPGTHAILLRALVLDKAVYEVMYEARNRPGWLSIPLGSIADSAADTADA